jgi:hypothetical protein
MMHSEVVRNEFSAFALIGDSSIQRPFAGEPKAGDFSGELRLRVAEFQAQQMSGLLNTPSAHGSSNSLDLLTGFIDDYFAGQGGSLASPDRVGRNPALFDPESAYQMMTEINTREVRYQAEYSEMTDMQAFLDRMQQGSLSLGDITGDMSEQEIVQRIQSFAENYNQWIDRFDDELNPGGLLSGTQAAQVSQWELEQSIENRFLGAKDGVYGMREIGFQIDPVSDRLSVDTGRFHAVFSSNPSGVVSALGEFSAHFARSAELLNAEGNFVPSRLGNLGRVIDYISQNKTSLQAEFGTGDAARPSAKLAAALAHYAEIAALQG